MSCKHKRLEMTLEKIGVSLFELNCGKKGTVHHFLFFIYFGLPLNQGWNASNLLPVVEGCMGFVANSTVKRDMYISGTTGLTDAYIRSTYGQQLDQQLFLVTHTPI